MPLITLPHDPSEYYLDARARQRELLIRIGATGIKWAHSRSIPKHWVGYSEENPSPGHDITAHVWYIDPNEQVLTLAMLAGACLAEYE